MLGVTAPGANPGEPFAENAMSWMLSLPVGAMFIVSGFMHTVFAKKTAANIGWQTNGFQYEIGFGSFGMGIAGFVAAGTDQTVAWVCVSIAASVFLLGAAANHFREMIKDKNFAPGNTIINIPVPGSEIELPFMGKNITFNGDWSFAAGTMTTPAGMSPGSVLTYDSPIVEFPPDNKNAV